MIGRVLGNFRVTGELGKGGMGVVYLAEHTLLGKQVAIKVLRRELSADETLVKRFFDEAKSTSNIHHPGIIDVLDFGYAEDGVAFIVMELLRGETLRARIKRLKRIPTDEALRIVAQVASALQAAHDHGIVHRDLKPANLFLVPDPDIEGGERVRILDFGVAKLTRDDSVATTESGAIIGTPVYMAPEQCSGAGTVDHRADLYSVGCILYEAICGKRPFNAKGRGQLIAMQMFDTPPPPSSLVVVSPGVERLILRLLEKEPDARVATAAQLGEQARSLLGEEPTTDIAFAETDAGLAAETLHSVATADSVPRTGVAPTSPASQPVAKAGRRRRTWVAVGAGLMLSVGGALWISQKRASRPPPSTTPVARDAAASAAPAPPVTTPPRPAAKGWIRIEPPGKGNTVVLGVTQRGSEPIPTSVIGLRASRNVTAPRLPYEIQQHEVTWARLDPWLAMHPAHKVYPPAWLSQDKAARADLPATGVPWSVAYAYCRAIGANLPTEAEWEYAARGAERRRHSWGNERIDLSRTRAYQGPGARLHSVKAYDQDRTPGPAARAVLGLMSNAREWTASLWREDSPGSDESWVQQKGSVYRAVRGLPIGVAQPKRLPAEGAAFRDALCAAPGCLVGREAGLQYVGFRCVRPLTAAAASP